MNNIMNRVAIFGTAAAMTLAVQAVPAFASVSEVIEPTSVHPDLAIVHQDTVMRSSTLFTQHNFGDEETTTKHVFKDNILVVYDVNGGDILTTITDITGVTHCGYVQGEYIELLGDWRTSNKQMKIRSDSKITAEALACVPKGTPVTVISEKGNWCEVAVYINYNIVRGFCAKSALTGIGE